MWAIEDLEIANPDKGTFLEHLLRIGATSEEVLAHTADSLEQRSGPIVALFGQLPFVIRAPNRVFHSPGWRSGVSVELSFLPGAGAVSPEGEFRQLGAIPEQERIGPTDEPVQFTQVIGFIRLWNKRGRLYPAYRKCLTGRGIRNETIGRIEDWMDLSEAKMPLPSRRYAPLTAAAFENEIARRMHTEFVRALHVFVRAYSVANLEMLPPTPKVYGYFAMVAPGRIASAAHPEPIVAGLSHSLTVQQSAMPDLDKVESLLSKALPHQDRVLRQLMAMNNLLSVGESELALIGCATTVEWFLNTAFPALCRADKRGRRISAAIPAALQSGLLDFLDADRKASLLDLAHRRNAFAHGAPPDRDSFQRIPEGVETEYVRSCLFLALDVYRAVNLHTGVGRHESTPKPLVVED